MSDSTDDNKVDAVPPEEVASDAASSSPELVPAVPVTFINSPAPDDRAGGGLLSKILKYSIPVVCAFLAAAIYLIIAHERELNEGGKAVGYSGEPVEEGGDYYVAVSLVEVAPTDKNGSSWETLGSTAPDPYVEIWWQGTLVFKSSVKEDTLIASWSDTELSLRDMALLGKKVSVDDVRQGARVNVRKGEMISFKIYDEDNISDTLIGEQSMAVTELRLGDQVLTPTGSSIRRMVIRTLPLKGQ